MTMVIAFETLDDGQNPKIWFFQVKNKNLKFQKC
jgi:hypothetical protein